MSEEKIIKNNKKNKFNKIIKKKNKYENNKLYVYILILILKLLYKHTHNKIYSLLSSFIMIVLGGYIIYYYIINRDIKVGDKLSNHLHDHDIMHAVLYVSFGILFLLYDLSSTVNCNKI